ncbi:hypothetical protein JCM6882_002476 [Rhodosporidiobolus microsporus]
MLATAAVAVLAFAQLDLSAAQVLANGNYFQAGTISSTWRWQASGALSYGRCPFSLKWSQCYISKLGATGNLQETTQADYLASLNPTTTSAAPAPTGSGVVWFPASANSRTMAAVKPLTSEERAMLDDEDLDSYFAAFPEQEEYRYESFFKPLDGSFKAKRQVVGCGTDEPTTTTTAPPSSTTTPGTTPTVSPRQRNEIFTWPGAVAGQTWKYTWKTFQSRTTSTNYQFFHAWQILRRDGCGGYSIAMDYVNGQIKILDAVRGCKDCAVFNKPISYWFGQPVIHEMTITYGINGAIDYKAYVAGNLRNPGLTYQATGDMGSSASLKFGNYRRSIAGMTEALAYLGDFTQTRLA